jgi:hypothetical protein
MYLPFGVERVISRKPRDVTSEGGSVPRAAKTAASGGLGRGVPQSAAGVVLGHFWHAVAGVAVVGTQELAQLLQNPARNTYICYVSNSVHT